MSAAGHQYRTLLFKMRLAQDRGKEVVESDLQDEMDGVWKRIPQDERDLINLAVAEEIKAERDW